MKPPVHAKMTKEAAGGNQHNSKGLQEIEVLQWLQKGAPHTEQPRS